MTTEKIEQLSLPWKSIDGCVVMDNGKEEPIICQIEFDMLDREVYAAYIAQACSTYPKLLEAMKVCVAYAEDGASHSALRVIKDMLAELEGSGE